MPTNTLDAPDLKSRWATFRDEHPDVRVRTAADRLGVSEAELVATGCGDPVTRLDGGWSSLLSRLETLGPVTALTRNDAAVHEKTGVYHDVTFTDTHNMGLVLADEIDLRLFMDHWHLGFAVEAPWASGRDGTRRSLQFFDRDGTAVHKVFRTRGSDRGAYEAIVDTYRHADQSIEQPVTPTDDPTEERPDDEIDVDSFLRDWGELRDTHDFFPLLRDYDVSRPQALRVGEGRFTRRVPDEGLRRTLRAAAEQETPIMVFVGSPGCLQIHTGPGRLALDPGVAALGRVASPSPLVPRLSSIALLRCTTSTTRSSSRPATAPSCGASAARASRSRSATTCCSWTRTSLSSWCRRCSGP
jgi:putative hemin transport protein